MKSILAIIVATAPLLILSSTSYGMSKGEYLAKIGDCTACHTLDKQAEFSGGKPFPTPIGTIYSTNITPDKTYGIGNYSFDDFDKVMRKGEAPGHWLYPAMPYTAYAKITEQDMRELYHYFMNEVKPANIANKDSDIIWPLSIRWPLMMWDAVFHDNTQFIADENQTVNWNRGAYLVQGLAHCGTCHTPRGFAMQEKALTEQSADYLTGEELENWFAVNLRGGNISVDELKKLLKTGRNDASAAVGPMAEAVTHSLQYLTDNDLQAIAEYIYSLPNINPPVSFTAVKGSQAGEVLYNRYCSTCHGMAGEGTKGVIPALAGNSIVVADNPASLINIVYHGSQLPLTSSSMAYPMPGYKGTLDNTAMVELLNYVRGAWGNKAPEVSKKQVAKINDY